MLNAWAEQSEKYHNGDINRDEYDKWRYNYPKYDEASDFVKVPSQNFSDAMAEAFKDKLKQCKRQKPRTDFNPSVRGLMLIWCFCEPQDITFHSQTTRYTR